MAVPAYLIITPSPLARITVNRKNAAHLAERRFYVKMFALRVPIGGEHHLTVFSAPE